VAIERLRVTVVYALPDAQRAIELEVPAGTTLGQAVERSRLLEALTPADIAQLGYGIHGRVWPADTVLADGDQVEIYRPLPLDPKQRRRQRVRDRSGR
jgi:uncharacterized protein